VNREEIEKYKKSKDVFKIDREGSVQLMDNKSNVLIIISWCHWCTPQFNYKQPRLLINEIPVANLPKDYLSIMKECIYPIEKFKYLMVNSYIEVPGYEILYELNYNFETHKMILKLAHEPETGKSLFTTDLY